MIVPLFAFTLSPGPGVVAIVSSSLSSGAWRAIPFIFGIILANVLYFLIATFGLAYSANSFESLIVVLRFGGAALLMWIGIQLFFTADKQALSDYKSIDHNLGVSFLAGLLVALGSPKVFLFYLSFLPATVDLTMPTALSVFAGTVVIVLVVGSTLGGYAIAGDCGRRVLASQDILVWINRLSGTLIIGSAIYILIG